MPVFIELNKLEKTDAKPVHIYTADVDHRALAQLKNLSQLPIIHSHIAAMPDVHAGIGATVGSVIPTRQAIIPAAVGVDIGCGMNAVRLSVKANQLPDSLKPLRLAIEQAVPVGRAAHKPSGLRTEAAGFLKSGFEYLIDKHSGIGKLIKQPGRTWISQLGTLGSGNHFIELCIDESDDVWIMLHSGSRGIGNAIGRHFISMAKKEMARHKMNLPDKDLAYLQEGSTQFKDYLDGVEWAQEYARINRQEMMKLTIEALKPYLPEFRLTQEAINCHHNYVSSEHHFGEQVYITRKGAISARKGELGIIPGSMGAKSFIVRGKGNPDSFCSCSHGAGRRMSRSQAMQRFKRRDLEDQTQGVECRKDKGVIDEIPAAYKDIDSVMENQRELIDVVHTLKQVVCIKG